MEQNNESSIIQRARQGDQDAISRLYEETKNYAYFVARRYLQNDEDIADMLQDAYISVFSNLGKFEDGRPFKPWLHSIVTNKCLNFIKSRRAVFVSVDEIAELVGDDEEIIPAAWLERAEKRRDIIRIVDGLPEGQRMAVTLFYFEGLSISDMAGIMGVAEGTVKAHLYYGRKTIKEEVLREERKGNKLYAIVPLPLLTQLFELEAEAAVMPEALSKAILEGTINSLAANGMIAGANAAAAGSAATGGAGGAGTSTTAAASTATGLAGKIAAMSVTAKIIAAAATIAVVTAGIITGSTLSQPPAPLPPTEQIAGIEPSVPVTADETAELDTSYTNIVVGDTITFGAYNGAPIEWRALEVADGKTLMITLDALELRPYNDLLEFVTWETCTLRDWLNGEFYNTAFSGSEQSQILQTTITNPRNTIDGGRSVDGSDTADKLFLLSIDEAERYFTINQALIAYYQGGITSWWLRSAGIGEDEAAYVNDHIVGVGVRVDAAESGVRPALWLSTPGSSQNTAPSQAYAAAYKQLLMDNRDAILGTELGGMGEYLFANGNVNIMDLTGDGVPELIFTLKSGDEFPAADLRIYSYDGESTPLIFTKAGVRVVADGDPQVILFLAGAGSVITTETGDTIHGDHGDTYTRYELGASGEFTAAETLTSYGYNYWEPELENIIYYRDGKEVSEQMYKNYVSRLTGGYNVLALYSNQYAWGTESEADPFIMSYDRAIEYLEFLGAE